MFPIFALLAAAALLASCGGGTPALIDHTPGPTPQRIATETEAKSIRLARIVVNMTRGERMGVVRGGWICTTQVPLVWPGQASFFDDAEVARTFNRALNEANYPVVGDPDALFGDTEDRPDLLVSGRITDLKANYCHPSNDDEVRGETSVVIEWQIYDPNRRRMIYKVTTRGAHQIDTAITNGRHTLFYNAISEATKALLADPSFYAIIVMGQPPRAPVAVEAAFRLNPRPTLSGAITQNMADLQAGTVTVLTGGGHGSGFFISADGFLLTNAHVVGDARFVRVRLASGREIAAEVIVVNRRRDIALVKVAEAGLPALSIATTELQIGSDVYAVGAPLDRRYATSVTRGIVSAYRVEDGLRMIQGDVATQKGNSGGPLVDAAGNVVGISVSGIAVGGAASSVNFFIPILDGLRGAGIELGEARVASQMRMLDRPVANEFQPGRPQLTPAKPETAAAPSSPPSSPPLVMPSPQLPPQQVAAAGPRPGDLTTLNGEYRSAFRAETLQGGLSFDLSVTVDGETIVGSGSLRGARGAIICRAVGALSGEQEAWIAVDCPTNRASYYLQLKGRFARDAAGAWHGQLAYTSNSGATGEVVFRQ